MKHGSSERETLIESACLCMSDNSYKALKLGREVSTPLSETLVN